MTVEIVLVDDHPNVREVLRLVLASRPSFAVVGEAEDGPEAIEIVESLRPDVVVMDVELPSLGGLEATRHLRESMPAVQVVMLSTHEHPHYVLEAFQAGAMSYVFKRAMGRDLVVAVEAAYQGERYLSPLIPEPVREAALKAG